MIQFETISITYVKELEVALITKAEIDENGKTIETQYSIPAKSNKAAIMFSDEIIDETVVRFLGE